MQKTSTDKTIKYSCLGYSVVELTSKFMVFFWMVDDVFLMWSAYLSKKQIMDIQFTAILRFYLYGKKANKKNTILLYFTLWCSLWVWNIAEVCTLPGGKSHLCITFKRMGRVEETKSGARDSSSWTLFLACTFRILPRNGCTLFLR